MVQAVGGSSPLAHLHKSPAIRVFGGLMDRLTSVSVDQCALRRPRRARWSPAQSSDFVLRRATIDPRSRRAMASRAWRGGRTLTRNRGHSGDESIGPFWWPLGAGLGVALANAGAAVFTGSSALVAEASHSLADSANDLVPVRRSATKQPSSQRAASSGTWERSLLLGTDRGMRRILACAAHSLRDGSTS